MCDYNNYSIHIHNYPHQTFIFHACERISIEHYNLYNVSYEVLLHHHPNQTIITAPSAQLLNKLLWDSLLVDHSQHNCKSQALVL